MEHRLVAASTIMLKLRKQHKKREWIPNGRRLDPAHFDVLLKRVSHSISKKDTRFRRCFPEEKRLGIFLVFLASGCTYNRLAGDFGVSESSIATIVKECAEAVIQGLNFYLKVPSTSAEWLVIG